MTVHRYLSGQKVNNNTKEILDEFMSKSGYRPNLTARSLVSKKTNLIGLIVPSVSYSFYPDLIQQIQKEIKKNGYNLILCVSNEDTEQELDEIDILLSIPVDGVIISPTSYAGSMDNCREIIKEKVPFVLIDRNIPGLNTSCVCTDSCRSSKEIVEHLISLGHRRIAHFGGFSTNSFSEGIRSGYRTALEENGLPVLENFIFSGPMTEENGYETFKTLLKMDKSTRPSAIQTANDIVAIGVMKAAKEMGVEIPKDIALVGFSDIRLSSMVPVPLTTIKEDTHLMAHEGVNLLVKQLSKKSSNSYVKKLPGKLIIRKSCGSAS
jgi:LacI family transcriptional regulator